MEKFRKPRHPSRLQVRVTRGEGEDRFTVLDVSETGMKLSGLMSLARGEKVRVAIQSISLTA